MSGAPLLIAEPFFSIDSREELRSELQGKPSGGVYFATIQKFTEDT